MKFNEFLRERRKLLGLSVREVERRSGVSSSYLSQLEGGQRGKKGWPGIQVLLRLADVLEVSVETLLEMAAAERNLGYPSPVHQTGMMESLLPEEQKTIFELCKTLSESPPEKRRKILAAIRTMVELGS